MVNYNDLQSSIHSAVDQYETYKSQSLSLKLDNISLESPSITTPTKTHSKRASIAIPSFQRSASGEAKLRPPNLRLHSNDSHTAAAATGVIRSASPATTTFDGRPSSPSVHAASPSSHGSSREFATFIQIATNFESANYLLDLDFLLRVIDFMRSEHPYTSKSLQQTIKARHTAKRKLWTSYTTEMQGLARSYTNKKPLATPAPSSPLNAATAVICRQDIKERKVQLAQAIAQLDAGERHCAESILSALAHLHTQANKDVQARYAMPDPINDKVTSIARHNERVRVFNQLIKFVAEDLRRIEQALKNTGQNGQVSEKRKDRKGSGVVEAVDSLCVEDYPPYK